jgi:hypothetical protein
VGGVNSANEPNRGQSEINIYNPADDQWRLLETELPADLVSPSAKILEDTLYVFGGGVNNWFSGDLRATYALPLTTDSAGELNSDRSVNGSDYLLWQQDALLGPVDDSDLADWSANYGTSATLRLAAKAVPAPRSMTLSALTLVLLPMLRLGRIPTAASRYADLAGQNVPVVSNST